MRGAWIEIALRSCCSAKLRSLPVRGAWIEIRAFVADGHSEGGRSPCGERGLKYCVCFIMLKSIASLPVRGAWIEIRNSGLRVYYHLCRSPCGERGLKFPTNGTIAQVYQSLPVRGAWIEMIEGFSFLLSFVVAPRAGSVD